jgi:tetratricopeptide (TPR) repeat protein
MLKNFSGLLKMFDFILKYSIYGLVFILPVLFFPWTSDVLDFNKQAILVLFVFLAFFSWMGKVLISGKLSFNANKTNVVILVLLAVYILSTIFSKDSHGSFWGWPSIVSESLLSLSGLVLLYLIVSNVFFKKEILNTINILALSAITVIFIGLLHLLGLFFPFNFSQSTSFNTIGLVGGLGLFTAILLPLLIVLEIYSKKWMKIIVGIGIIINIAVLIIVNYFMVWWVVLAGCALLILFSAFKKGLFDLRWLGLPMFFLVLALFFLILRPQVPVPQRSAEIYLNQSATFDIAIKSLKENPVLGSGPGTFIHNFSLHKNPEFNQGILWNVRFDKGGSKILNVLATMGILGFASFLALISIVLFYGVKFIFDKNSNQESEESSYVLILSGAVLIAFIAQTIGYFLYNSNLSLDFLYFLLIAVFIGLNKREIKNYTLNPSSFLTLGVAFVFTLFFIFGLGILILGGQRYFAEISYAKGVKSLSEGQIEQGMQDLERAVRLNLNSDLYLTQLSQVYLSKMGQVAVQEDLTESDRNRIIELLINNAINSAKMATDANPKNVNNWFVRGFVYQNLIGVVPESENWAITSYQEAIQLDPNSPYYYTQKGVAYMAKANIINKDNSNLKNQDLDEAKKLFEKAIELKSDYAPARFQIAMVYQAKGQTNQEVAALEDAKKHSPRDIGLLFQIGLLYYQKGDFDKARSNLELAINISPNYSNALYFLGLSYSKLNQRDRAIAQFQKILELNPENQDVKTILSNLQSGKDPLSGIVQEEIPQAPVQEESPENL